MASLSTSLLSAVLVLALFVGWIDATNFYISPRGSDAIGCGWSSESACASLRFLILAGNVTDGDTVVAAPGVYNTSLGAILWQQNLTIQGEAEPSPSRSLDGNLRAPPKPLRWPTVIFDCAEAAGPAMRIRGSGVYISDVLFRNCHTIGDAGAVLVTGDPGNVFTCHHCVFQSNSAINPAGGGGGGAIYSDGLVIIKHCNFFNNTAEQFGGAISANSIDIADSHFSFNRIYYSKSRGGGAVFAELGLVANRSEFVFNSAGLSSGGALHADEMVIEQCEFRGNRAGEGGALHSVRSTTVDSAVVLSDCSFENNFAVYGGALAVHHPMLITRCYFRNNTGFSGGCVWTSRDMVVRQSSFIKNSGTNGGAVYLDQNGDIDTGITPSNVDFHVSDSDFIGNSAVAGGALYLQAVSDTFNDTLVSLSNFTDNSATVGGAIYAVHTTHIDRSLFENNSASCKGGAIIMPVSALDGEDKCDESAKRDAAARLVFGLLATSPDELEQKVGRLALALASGTPSSLGVLAQKDAVVNVTQSRFSSNMAWPEPPGVGVVSSVAGGAIFGPVYSYNCTFFNNSAEAYGGAIFGTLSVEVHESDFTSNRAGTKNSGSGGAIYTLTSMVQGSGGSFSGNSARFGGAIMAPTLRVYGIVYTANKANNGGALYVTKVLTAENLIFHANVANSNQSSVSFGKGGAIFAETDAIFECNQCAFDNNRADVIGGGVCAQGLVSCTACSFDFNSAGSLAGSVWVSGPSSFLRSNFNYNTAGFEAGALLTNGASTLTDCSFNNNSAAFSGGAIVSANELTLTRSSFLSNAVGTALGGAAWSHSIKSVNCTFAHNTGALGGALAVIYSASFSGCVFEHNEGQHGGAIFGSARGSQDVLAIDRSEFLYNKAVVGGAIHWRTWPSTVILTQSNFYANRAVNSSAISILAIGEIQHCNFSYNLAEEYGIVSLERKGSVSFVSCNFTRNVARIIGGYQGVLMLDPEQWGLFSYATCNTTITTDPTTNNTITEQTVKVGAIVGQFVNCYFHRNRRHPAGADIAGIATPNITAGQAEEVYIESYDYCGQPLGFGGSPRAFIVEVTLETQSANPGASFNVTPVDNSDGSYTATVPLNISGTYSVALVIYDAFVSQSNYRITVLPGPPTPTYSSAFGGNLTSLVLFCVPNPAEFAIQTRDQYGNNCTGDMANVTALVTPSNMTSSPEIAATIIPINNGQYLATYNVSVTGTYLTNVFVDGVAISGSPYPTKVTRSPVDVLKSKLIGVAVPTIAGAGGSFQVKLFTSDYGVVDDDCACGACLHGSLEHGSTTLMARLSDCNGLGVYTFEYNATVSGMYSVQLLYGTQSFPAEKVEVVPGPVSAATSVVWGSLLEGGEAQNVYDVNVVMKDSYGNNYTCDGAVTPVVALSCNSTKVLPIEIQCLTTVYQVSYYMIDVGICTVLVTIEDQPLMSKDVTFLPYTSAPSELPPLIKWLIIALVVTVIIAVSIILIFFAAWARQGCKRIMQERITIPDFDARKLSLEELMNDSSIRKIPWDEFEMGKKLGAGGGGVVYHAIWHRPNGQTRDVAIKQMLVPLDGLTQRDIQEFLVEIKLTSALHNKYVVEFVGISFPTEDEVCFVTEYMSRGSVRQLLKSKGSNIPTKIRFNLAIHAAKGLAYLHKNKVIHRDVKPANLLVSGDWTCKIGDFGISTIKATVTRTMTAAGTPIYMAPEVLRKDRYSEKADVYSFGVSIYEIFTARNAYEGGYQNLRSDLVKQIIAGRRPDISDLPPLLGQFMAECWHDDPRMRPTFPEIVQRLIRLKAVRFPDQLTSTDSRTFSSQAVVTELSDDSLGALDFDVNTNPAPDATSPLKPTAPKARPAKQQQQQQQQQQQKQQQLPGIIYGDAVTPGSIDDIDDDNGDLSLKDITGEGWGHADKDSYSSDDDIIAGSDSTYMPPANLGNHVEI